MIPSHVVEDRAAGHPVLTWEWGVLAAAVSVTIFVGLWAVLNDPPLIYDEATYALRVRDIVVGDVDGFYWIDVRASGLPLLLTPAWLLAGGSEVALRLGAVFLATAAVVLTWWVARMWLTRGAAAISAGLLGLSAAWLDTGWQILPDIPGVALTLAAVGVLSSALQRERVPWWVLAIAPLAGLATAVRYGAPTLLAPALLVVCWLYWGSVRSSLLRIVVTGSATFAAVSAVWFVPWVTGANRPPVLVFAERQTGKEIPVMERMATFLDLLPGLFGPVVGPLAAVGVIAAVVQLARYRLHSEPIVAALAIVVLTYLLLIVGVADLAHRYLVPGMPFLAILAGSGLAIVTGGIRTLPLARYGGIALAFAAVAVGATLTGKLVAARTESLGPLRSALIDAGHGIDDCIVISSTPQQSAWYSGCEGVFLPAGAAGRVGVAPDPIVSRRRMLRAVHAVIDRGIERGIVQSGSTVQLVLQERKSRDPQGAARQALVGYAETIRRFGASPFSVTVLRLGTVADVAAWS